MMYVVEYCDYDGVWRLRGKYTTYKAALARWRNHYHHCPYLVCRIRREKKPGGGVMDVLMLMGLLIVVACVFFYLGDMGNAD